MAPGFEYEKQFWEEGLLVCGVDEVGRGAFAGPLVAAACAFAPGISNSGPKIDDSKRLSRKQREMADEWIRSNALSWHIGEASVGEINKLGMARALKIAYGRAVAGLEVEVEHVLLDGIGGIIRGDQKSFSIAAASIVAKVYRDKILCDIACKSRYSAYSWHKNMGYGTAEHRKAILMHGMTDYHREQFVRTFLRNFFASPSLSCT